jgi:Cu/Ag efflux protein CusF
MAKEKNMSNLKNSIILLALAKAMILAVAVVALSFWSLAPVLAQGHDHGGHGSEGGSSAEATLGGVIYEATGEVVEIDLGRSRLLVSHGPIPQVGWEAMTMGFDVEDPTLLEDLTAGDKITMYIRFRQGPSGIIYSIADLEKS